MSASKQCLSVSSPFSTISSTAPLDSLQPEAEPSSRAILNCNVRILSSSSASMCHVLPARGLCKDPFCRRIVEGQQPAPPQRVLHRKASEPASGPQGQRGNLIWILSRTVPGEGSAARKVARIRPGRRRSHASVLRLHVRAPLAVAAHGGVGRGPGFYFPRSLS